MTRRTSRAATPSCDSTGAADQRHERQRLADETLRRAAEGLGEGGIDERDFAGGVATHDQVALGVDQAAVAFLAFAKLPGGVGQRLELVGEPHVFGGQPGAPRGELLLVDPLRAPQRQDGEGERQRAMAGANGG